MITLICILAFSTFWSKVHSLSTYWKSRCLCQLWVHYNYQLV